MSNIISAQYAISQIESGIVDRAYSGRSGCMCGCRGKYTKTSAMLRSVKTKMIEAGEVEVINGFDGETIYAAEINGRQVAVYMSK